MKLNPFQEREGRWELPNGTLDSPPLSFAGEL